MLHLRRTNECFKSLNNPCGAWAVTVPLKMRTRGPRDGLGGNAVRVAGPVGGCPRERSCDSCQEIPARFADLIPAYDVTYQVLGHPKYP